MDNAVDLESGNRTSIPSKKAVPVSGKGKIIGSEVELGSVRLSKNVSFENGDGSDGEKMGMRSEIGRVDAGKSCLSSDFSEKTLTEFGLSELEMIARARAGIRGLVPMLYRVMEWCGYLQ